MKSSKTVIVVDSSTKGVGFSLSELLQYKDLFFTLAYRDYRIRYAQTLLGLLWVVIQPLTTLTIFFIVFGKAISIDTGGVAYPLFAICGMSAWAYFAFVLQQSGNSIIGSQEMIKKIYFPRIIIPLSKAVVGLVDFGVTFLFIVGLLIYNNYLPGSSILFLPAFILATLFASLGTGIWVSALTIKYRDFQHVVPFMVQIGLYATPIGYPSSLIVNSLSPWATFIYYLNPMAGIAEGFRWSILGIGEPTPYIFVSLSMALIIFLTSLLYFKRAEKTMADIV